MEVIRLFPAYSLQRERAYRVVPCQWVYVPQYDEAGCVERESIHKNANYVCAKS
jgi:hypothetical protein